MGSLDLFWTKIWWLWTYWSLVCVSGAMLGVCPVFAMWTTPLPSPNKAYYIAPSTPTKLLSRGVTCNIKLASHFLQLSKNGKKMSGLRIYFIVCISDHERLWNIERTSSYFPYLLSFSGILLVNKYLDQNAEFLRQPTRNRIKFGYPLVSEPPNMMKHAWIIIWGHLDPLVTCNYPLITCNYILIGFNYIPITSRPRELSNAP